jgi:ubiquinone biosynthesis protein
MSQHGLGYLAGVLGLQQRIPFQRGWLGHEPRDDAYARPEHVRLALEEMGATFVKLGQILSTRPDLLPESYQHELAKLQDSSPALPGSTIREVIAQELGHDVQEAFADFADEPLATGSIGQAHAATLFDGTEVVVKVRRPGVMAQIEEDLEILRNLADHASRKWRAVDEYDVIGLAEEFSSTLKAELDYLQEGRSAERFADNFKTESDVHVPRVFWETTTSRVLTLERIRGINVSDLAGLDAAGIDRHALAERATNVTAKMIFEDRFFHADPHPGNLFIEPNGTIGIIDFGMVGTIDENLRAQLATLLVSVARKNPDRIADAVLDLAIARVEVDRHALSADLGTLLARYEGKSIGEIQFTRLIGQVLVIVRHHHLRLPRELALILKMLSMNEGMAVEMDPQFQIGEVVAPFARRLAAEEFTPAAFARRLARSGINVAQFGAELPELLMRLTAVIDEGGMEVHLRAAELEPLVARVERLGNRLVAGVVAAAFIEGIAELLTVEPSRRRAIDRPLLAVGAGAVGSLGAYLVWTGRRGKRPLR